MPAGGRSPPVDSLSRGDLLALETQGRFLEEKFASPDLFTS